MIEDTITRIETRLAQANLPESQREELKSLLLRLKAELGELGKTDFEQALSVAGFAEVTSNEAARKTTNPTLLEIALQGFESSVEGLELSHPQLVKAVNSICRFLSSSGV
jgi:hypothetical protein